MTITLRDRMRKAQQLRDRLNVAEAEIQTEIERRERGVETWLGALIYTDALGQKRCGLTGVLTSRCECYAGLYDDVVPRPNYAGSPSLDWETDDWTFPGQAPLAITAG